MMPAAPSTGSARAMRALADNFGRIAALYEKVTGKLPPPEQ